MSAYASDLAAMVLEKAKPYNSLGGIWHCGRGVSSLSTFVNEQVSKQVRQLLKDIGGPHLNLHQALHLAGVIPEINEHRTPLSS